MSSRPPEGGVFPPTELSLPEACLSLPCTPLKNLTDVLHTIQDINHREGWGQIRTVAELNPCIPEINKYFDDYLRIHQEIQEAHQRAKKDGSFVPTPSETAEWEKRRDAVEAAGETAVDLASEQIFHVAKTVPFGKAWTYKTILLVGEAAAFTVVSDAKGIVGNTRIPLLKIWGLGAEGVHRGKSRRRETYTIDFPILHQGKTVLACLIPGVDNEVTHIHKLYEECSHAQSINRVHRMINPSSWLRRPRYTDIRI